MITYKGIEIKKDQTRESDGWPIEINPLFIANLYKNKICLWPLDKEQDIQILNVSRETKKEQ